MCRDKRRKIFDVAAVVEVIEHLDAQRLAAFRRVLFEFAKPATVVAVSESSIHIELSEIMPEHRISITGYGGARSPPSSL